MKKKKILLILAAVTIVAALAVAFWPSSKEVTFSTKVLDTGVVQNTVTATGNLEPVDEVEVGTQVSGVVQKVYVDYNSHVKKGQLLAELDKSTLNERLTQAQNQVTSSQSALKRAQQVYDRTKSLYENKAATQEDYETAENSLVQAKASLLNAQTSLREAKVNLGYAEIYSPIDGVVLSKEIEEGQTVASSFNTPTLFIIAKDLKNMQVEANVDEADIGQVKVGQKVTFTVDAYTGETFNGQVSQIRLQPTTTSNVVTYTVVIMANNPEEKLFPGMTASIEIITQEQTGNLIPLEACNFTPTEEIFKYLDKPQHKGGEPKHRQGEPQPNDSLQANHRPSEDEIKNSKTVWVKNGNSLSPRRITLGLSDGVNAVLKNGKLNQGDTIVLSAIVGQKQKPKEAGANLFGPKKPNGGNRNGGGPGGPR